MINSIKDFFPQNTKLPELDDQTKKAKKENDKKFKNQLNEICEEFVVKQETGDAEDTSEDEEETPEDDLPMNDIKIEAVDDSELLEQTQHDIEDIQSDYQSDAEEELEGVQDGAEKAPEDEKTSDSENGRAGDENEEVAEDKEVTDDKEATQDKEVTEDSVEDTREADEKLNQKPVSKQITSVDLTEDDDEEKSEIDQDKKLILENQKLLEETSAGLKSKNHEEDTKNRPGSEEKENFEQPIKMQNTTRDSKADSAASLESYMERLSTIVNELYKGRGFTELCS